MPLQRTTHWATRELHDFLESSATKSFQWGVHDCCLFAADAILAMTGADIADAFRGKYNDEASAFSLIKSVTGGSTVAGAAEYCALQYGLEEYPFPLMAKRGDLAVVEESGRLIAGIVHLTGRHVVSVGEDGLKRLCISTVQRSWAV